MARSTSQANALSGLLSPELQQIVKRRDLRLALPIWGSRHGAHRSNRPGVGQDFRDHRPYDPGDDLRRLDWRAAGRSERLVVRRTESEDELALRFAIDASGGMAYGEGTGQKFRTAAAMIAGLASLAARQGDPVGFVLGRNGAADTRSSRPRTGNDRLRELAAALEEPATGTCPWEAMLAELAQRRARRSLVIAVSDFLDPSTADLSPEEADAQLMRMLVRLRAGRHEVVLLQVVHADEVEFPWTKARVLRLEDLRNVHDAVEGPGPSLRTRYLERLAAHQEKLAAECEQGGLHLHQVVAGRPLGPAFLGLLARLSGHAAEVAS